MNNKNMLLICTLLVLVAIAVNYLMQRNNINRAIAFVANNPHNQQQPTVAVVAGFAAHSPQPQENNG